MTAKFWMLELRRTAWQLYACLDGAVSSVVEEQFAELELVAQSQRICDVLVAGSYQGEPIVVALGSTLSLSATLTVSRPQELRDRQTMLYRLEECIPWSTEECVGDFSRAGSSALMVAVRTEPLAEFFAQIEKLGVHIQSIVPKALLAAAEHVHSSDSPDPHIAAFQQDGWIDLLSIDAGKPSAWSSFPVAGSALRYELKHLATEIGRPLPFVGYNLGEAAAAVKELDSAHLIESVSEQNETYDTLALKAAKRILGGELESPIDLKRDAFGQRRGNAALRRYSGALQNAAAVLILVSAVALLWRGLVAGREAEFVAAREVEAFRRTFPNTKIPIGIRGRLESELAKLKGLQGDDTSLRSAVSATTMLHGLLTALPTDRRFCLLEIRIEDGRLYVDAEVREHGDAEVIAQRLRSGGFEVASPRTQRFDDKRVSLRITGTMKPSAKVASRKTS